MTNLPEPPPRSLELRIDREALADVWQPQTDVVASKLAGGRLHSE
mgnify:CR=1 FL=1